MSQMSLEYLDGQELVNSQVSINRAVFEMNKTGRKINSGEDPNVRVDYILTEVEEVTINL